MSSHGGPVDPVSTAVISWATGQLGVAGQRLVRRVFIGDRQRNALVRVVHEAIDSAVAEILPIDDQEIVREALKRESPDSAELRRGELTDLKGAVLEYVLPTLSVLDEQGYRIDVNRFSGTLASLISRGIQADAAQGGPLEPAAELLRFQLLMELGEKSVARLTELTRRPTAFGDLLDSVIDITALFDELELIEPATNHEAYDTYRAPFVGREWLVELIDNFVATQNKGYLLIEGEAGVGKSSFALWLAATRGYPAHFTRLPGGRETAVAVKNLSAQLIIQMRLDELAPGGALPAASSQQSWLQQVIQVAAARRRESRNSAPLILIVDGLDEAEPASGPPLGLPASLPEGVFIIVTTRVGVPLRWIRANKTSLKILADDNANIEDMRRYLYQTASEPRIAALLSSSKLGIDQFVDALIDRSAGIWVYLRYVLEEMRNGSRLPTRLDDLPNGLWDYYTENLNQLRSDIEQWDRFFLPVLATLAAAQEPVTPSVLASFANLSVSPGEIVRFLANKWRPFCVRLPGERYSLFHQRRLFRHPIRYAKFISHCVVPPQ
jgi:AAA ATPase domain